MFAVVLDLKARHARRAKPGYQRCQRPVAFTREFDRVPLPQQTRPAANATVAALRLEAHKLPRRRALDVLAPEHRLQFRATNFPPEPIHFIIGNWAKLTL